jgi:hypothetical protein
VEMHLGQRRNAAPGSRGPVCGVKGADRAAHRPARSVGRARGRTPGLRVRAAAARSDRIGTMAHRQPSLSTCARRRRAGLEFR